MQKKNALAAAEIFRVFAGVFEGGFGKSGWWNVVF
jgi:hypothetical protein